MLLLVPLLLLLASCAAPPAQAPPVAEFQVDPATAATVHGRVTFSGKRPSAKRISLDADPQCAALYPSASITEEGVVVGKEGGVAGAFVSIHSGLEGKHFAVPETPVTIVQKGCQFAPRVLGIRAGQPFHVVNDDPVTHNIHPQPRTNRDWNQSQAPGDPPLVRRFAAPEAMVPIRCNVHNWMRAWVGVMDHPYFATTDVDGGYVLPKLPPGTYTISVWQEKLGVTEQTVTVTPGANSELHFVLKGI